MNFRNAICNPRRRTALAALALSCCAAFTLATAGLAPAATAYAEESTPTSAVSNSPMRMVSVTGSATVSVDPDVADLYMGILVEDETATGCQTLAAEKVDGVRDALVDAGIPEKSIVVTDVNMYSRYDRSGDVDELVGYRMNVSINIMDLPVDQIGSTIATATSAGCNQVDYASYHRSDYDVYYAQALEGAVKAAQAKAQVLADAAGYELGPVTTLHEGYDGQEFRRNANYSYDAEPKDEAAAAEGGFAGGLTLNPGQLDIRADVTATFEMTVK